MSLPAWSLPAAERERIAIDLEWPDRVDAEWAFGDSTGAGVKVCVLDSGVEPQHPLVGEVERSVVGPPMRRDTQSWGEDTEGDSSATEPPVQGSSARWPPSARSPAPACWGRPTRAAAP